MVSIKDWVLSQLVSNTLSSSRPLSASEHFLSPSEEYEHLAQSANVATPPASVNASVMSSDNPENQNQLSSQQQVQNSFQANNIIDEKNPLARIEQLQIKFLLFLRRLGLSEENLMVSKVLYRIHLATMIRAKESDFERGNLKFEKAGAIAAEQEAFGQPELDFSFKILVLGKTGVGKSSTINSIFDQKEAVTNAFRPATTCIQEIIGTVKGVKISFIDTPGLLPFSLNTVRKNRKLLLSVKKFVRKNSPDMVLYFERLDMINTTYSDFPLLKLVTEVFGPAIWLNTILVMTHSSSALPEGPQGYPVAFESYVTRCTDVVQHYIRQAVSGTKLENPVILVENHPHCKTNDFGAKILPNGKSWIQHFFLSCICAKVLNDVNAVLDFEDSMQLGPYNITRLPLLPHLLSSFLKHRAPQVMPDGAQDLLDEDVSLLDPDEEDEYDQLPPIRILTKAQFKKLSDQQKRDYLDELDYRETLYLKKQLKEESLRQREKYLSQGDDNSDVEPVLLPDMAVPLSFDSDSPAYRYRCIVTSEKWLARPVLDPHGWDHDVSFDGINLETATNLSKNIVASITGQLSKNKQDLSIQSECAAAYVNPRGPTTYSLGLDVQSTGKDFICTVHGNTKMRNLKHNTTECGISVMPFGGKYYLGAKLEDSFRIGKRLKFSVNAGRMGGAGQVGYGGSFAATIRGKDFPIRNESISLGMTLVSFKKETMLSGNLQSDFRLSRSTNVSINANLNSRKMGQVAIKTSSSERIEIAAFVAIFSILRGILQIKAREETLETG